MSKTSKAGGRKKAVFKRIVELAKQYPIIGIVDMANLPTPQLQRMRAQLRGQVEIFMAKKRVVKKAILKLKDIVGLDKLNEYLEKAQPALIFTKDNPFTLFKILKKNKSKAPAKADQIAPNDIIVPAGPTPFAPGPVIGELGALGIKSGVEAGKIAIKNDTTVCKEGDVIKEALASILTRLGIEPMEIGLTIKAVYENGVIYTKTVLDVDEEQFMTNLNLAATEAYNLAIEASYFCSDTTEEIVKKAFREAKAVAKEGKIMCDLIAEELVEQAEREMLSVKSELKDIPVQEKKEEPKKEEKPKEEVKETPKEKPKVEAQEKQSSSAPQKSEDSVAKPEMKKEAPKVEEKLKEEVKEASKVEEKKEEKPKVEEKKEEVKKEMPKVEKKKEEPKVEEKPKEEPKLEEKKPEPVKEEPKKEEVAKEEPKVEEKKSEEPEPKVEGKTPEKLKEEVPKAADLKKEADEKKSTEPEEKSHPKQGKVTQDQAADLLNQLQKEGTLRNKEEK